MKVYHKKINDVDYKISKETDYWRCENDVEVFASYTKRGAIKAAKGDKSEMIFHSWK